jgi:hypothetical protein
MGLAKIKGQNGKDFTGTKWCYIHCDFCMAALISMNRESYLNTQVLLPKLL